MAHGNPSRLDIAAYCAARHPNIVVLPQGSRPICGGGWDRIVTDALDRIGCIVGARRGARVEIADVEEKYGTLRIELVKAGLTRRQRGLVNATVDAAEERSAATCELCGASGRLRYDGWHVEARCEGHGKGKPESGDPRVYNRERGVSRRSSIIETARYDRETGRVVVLKRRKVSVPIWDLHVEDTDGE
jgi:hypothetical protein